MIVLTYRHADRFRPRAEVSRVP